MFLPSGGDLVPFVHPRKYAPEPYLFTHEWRPIGKVINKTQNPILVDIGILGT